MKLKTWLQKLGLALATAGLLVPNVGVAADSSSQAPARQSASAVKVVDVSLTEGGRLQGQVVNGNGVAQASTPVVIQQGQESVAKVTTDKNGSFAVDGLKGGVYVVSTEKGSGVVRAWSPRTAPPSAVKEILLIQGNPSVRAQGVVQRFGVGAIVVGTIAATVIAVSIDHNSSS